MSVDPRASLPYDFERQMVRGRVDSISVRILRPAATALQALGFDVNVVLAPFGVTATVVADDQARVHTAKFAGIWALASEKVGPHFGARMAATIDFAHDAWIGPGFILVWLMLTSANVAEALDALEKYSALTYGASGYVVERASGGARRVTFRPSREFPAAFTEFLVAWLVQLLRGAPLRPVRPISVSFRHGGDLAALESLFHAPVHSQAEYDGIVIAANDLAIPMRGADAARAGMLREHADATLATLIEERSLADEVRALLRAQIARGPLDADVTARRLGLSRRTLSRHLELENTSHRALLDEVRAELAREYLTEQQVTLSEVAARLGFADASAFHRAFRRWFGVAPTDFRETSAARSR